MTVLPKKNGHLPFAGDGPVNTLVISFGYITRSMPAHYCRRRESISSQQQRRGRCSPKTLNLVRSKHSSRPVVKACVRPGRDGAEQGARYGRGRPVACSGQIVRLHSPHSDDKPPFDLHGHVAIVTGANHGIGAATARMLAACGAAVLASYLPVKDPGNSGTPETNRRNRASDAEHVLAAERSLAENTATSRHRRPTTDRPCSAMPSYIQCRQLG
jgi:hypothetical protein